MLKRSLASLLDQALLSGLNLGAGVFLIHHVSKDEYGSYVQWLGIGVLMCAVLDALVANAVANLSSRLPEADMPQVLANAQRLAGQMAWVLALLAGLGIGLSVWWGAASATPAVALDGGTATHTSWFNPTGSAAVSGGVAGLAFAVYMAALCVRDFQRTLLYLQQQTDRVLRLDATFVAVCALAGLGLYALNALTVVSIFCAMALANLVALWVTPSVVVTPPQKGWAALQAMAATCWGIARWAIPGVVVGWAATSGYLYITGITLGQEATAELNASRLAIMPLILLTMAWHQMARADIARVVGDDRAVELRRLVLKSAVWLLVPTLAYMAVWGLAHDWIKPWVVTKSYVHFDDLVFIWWAYFAVYGLKFLGMAMLVGFEAYHPLFKLSAATLLLQMVLLWQGTLHFGIEAAVWVLALTETVELLVIWGLMLPPRWRAMKA